MEVDLEDTEWKCDNINKGLKEKYLKERKEKLNQKYKP